MICHGWPYDITLKIPKDSNNPVKAKTLLKLRAEADEIHSEKEKQLQKELQEKRKLREQQMRPEKQSLQEVTLAGAGNYLEIWSAAEWSASAEQRANSEMNSQQFALIDLAFTTAGGANDGTPDLGAPSRA